MDEIEKARRAKELRDNGRDSRRNASIESGSTDQHSTGDDTTVRSSFQDVGRDSQSTAEVLRSATTSDGKSGNNKSSSSGLIGGNRRTIGRPRKDNSRVNQPTDVTAATDRTGSEVRTEGRLETDEPIKERPEEGKPDFSFHGTDNSLSKETGRYKEDYRWNIGYNAFVLKRDKSKRITKEEYNTLISYKEELKRQTKARAESFLKIGPVLSVEDAERLYEPLKAALHDNFAYMDEGIWLYAMSAIKEPIWSDIDDEELDILVKFLLKRAQKDPVTASFVRVMIDTEIYVQLGMITVPRVIKTYGVLKGSPRPLIQQRKREERRERLRHANRS